ncbi:C2 and GRAM domain-containing protein [Ananas comosus]|uniref:C2 and GRAM domain-containing protein n=1 Tax=Ananas comosus TaxID=4615 RepID=A0A199VSF3_ANACO|nr:C2 and GRAM domain-containing protein [Ananas comosus]
MRLFIHVIEARNLPAIYLNGTSDPYVRLQLGKRRAKTTAVKKCLNPLWDEEFSFLVGDISEELIVSVLNEDKFFNNDFLGRVKVPLYTIMKSDNLSLETAWYQLQPKNKKSKNKKRGEIRLTIHLVQKNSSPEVFNCLQTYSEEVASNSDRLSEIARETPLSSNSSMESSVLVDFEEIDSAKEIKPNSSPFVDFLSLVFNRKRAEASPTSSPGDVNTVEQLQEAQVNMEACENQEVDLCSNEKFDEFLKIMASKDEGGEMPGNLSGGVLLDQCYVVAPNDLNSLLFSPTSNFWPSVAEVQGSTGLQIEPWILCNNECLKRTLTFTKAASKLVKSVKATEEQTYMKADGSAFAVLASVSIPDVPCGSYFRTEILYCIKLGPALPSEDQTSHLLISWRINFIQSTMMKGMIESGARQGLIEGFAQFAEVLSRNVKAVEVGSINLNKEQILASIQTQPESILKLAFRFLGNFTFICSLFMGLFVLAHLQLAKPNVGDGLEFIGIDLPDSVGEFVVSAILVLQAQHFLNVMGRFLQAWKRRGSDHGVKAQGDGWLLTVALIEGTSIASVDSSGFSDPYVVFTCNGKTKTSSIKFHTAEPKWNEIFEFDAMDDPPSRMDVNIYDFEGPFDEAVSLGHAEVNFLKSNISDLADVWIPLQGKFAQACQSKLHLRIFLNNSKGSDVVTQYITKMEKEVGKKINLRSPQTNSAFQKLFNLPPEEFLINDFTCHLKRKMPLQGRLFLSPRIFGFYANIFGHKTKFFFLWEDIDDIHIIPPSLASVGSPSLMVILCEGRGSDARHAAKALDQYGRLKFHFQSFVSFQEANRTIMALWKARSLSPEQKVEMVEKQFEAKRLQTEESGSFLGIDEVKMSEVFSSVLSVDANSLTEMFAGGQLEHKVMLKVGCVDYSTTPWEPVNSNTYQRQISYKFDKSLSRYGGEATTTQQKSSIPDQSGWIIEEVMTLQGVLLGDNFSVRAPIFMLLAFIKLQLKYQACNIPDKTKACNVQASLGIAWLKSTKHQKRITQNIMSNSSIRLKEIFSEVEKELMNRKHG